MNTPLRRSLGLVVMIVSILIQLILLPFVWAGFVALVTGQYNVVFSNEPYELQMHPIAWVIDTLIFFGLFFVDARAMRAANGKGWK